MNILTLLLFNLFFFFVKCFLVCCSNILQKEKAALCAAFSFLAFRDLWNQRNRGTTSKLLIG